MIKKVDVFVFVECVVGEFSDPPKISVPLF